MDKGEHRFVVDGVAYVWRPGDSFAYDVCDGDAVPLPLLMQSAPLVEAYVGGWTRGIRQGFERGEIVGADRLRAQFHSLLGVPSANDVERRLAAVEGE